MAYPNQFRSSDAILGALQPNLPGGSINPISPTSGPIGQPRRGYAAGGGYDHLTGAATVQSSMDFAGKASTVRPAMMTGPGVARWAVQAPAPYATGPVVPAALTGSVTLAPPPFGVSMPAKVVKKPVTFVSRVTAAEALIGKKNILEPKAAKEFLMANSSTVLLLDVQDPGSESIPGAYNASLGTLFFKADATMEEFKDPKIADLPKDNPILVTCALGGQAKIGAKILVEYGFTNVKVIEGGCVAWNK